MNGVFFQRVIAFAAAFAMACTENAPAISDASPTDASDADAATCATGVLSDLDSQIAEECSNRRYELDGGQPLNVWVSTGPACGGHLVLVEQDGVDTQTVYLYDAVTRKFVEKTMGSNGNGTCVASADGVAIECLMIAYGPTPAGFVDACADAGDAAAD